MTTVLFVGAHVLRLAEPAVVAVRLSGRLTHAETTEMLLIAREHLAGRPGRVLLDFAQLGAIPADCLMHLDGLLAEAASPQAPPRQVALVRAQTNHMTMLAPLANLSRQDQPSSEGDAAFARLFMRSFARPEEALVWMGLPSNLLWATHDTIYLTHIF